MALDSCSLQEHAVVCRAVSQPKEGFLQFSLQMTTSPKFFLHLQGEHPFPAELLLSTNQEGQLLALTMVWMLLEADTALTICVGGVIHGVSNCRLLLSK